MIQFEKGQDLQVINVKVDVVIKWSKHKLEELFKYKFKVGCNPHIGKNILNFNVDETEMSEEQWEAFSERFNTTNGYSDQNLKRILIEVFGEAEYTFKVHELDQFYIIRHKGK